MHQGPLEALTEIVERISTRVREGGTVHAFLAGGTATFLHLARTGKSLAQQARHSEDVDIHFAQRPVLDDDIVIRYEDAEGQERLLALDQTYSIDIGLRHPDCFDDAEFLFKTRNGRLHLYVLNPMDLAVTKVGRFQDHDQLDIQLLARANLLDAAKFEQRATEALDYLATDPAMIKINIGEAVTLIQEVNKASSGEQ